MWIAQAQYPLTKKNIPLIKLGILGSFNAYSAIYGYWALGAAEVVAPDCL